MKYPGGNESVSKTMLNHHVEKKRRYFRFDYLSSDTSIPYGSYTGYVDISFSFLNKDLSRKSVAVAIQESQEGITDHSMPYMAIHLPLILLSIHEFGTLQHSLTDGIDSLHLTLLFPMKTENTIT